MAASTSAMGIKEHYHGHDEAGPRLGTAQKGQQGQDESQAQAARVAHEYLSRRKIVKQVAHEGAQQGES